MRMRCPFLQELSKVMNSDCYANRCDDQISFVPVSLKFEQSLLYLDLRGIQENYTMELSLSVSTTITFPESTD